MGCNRKGLGLSDFEVEALKTFNNQTDNIRHSKVKEISKMDSSGPLL